VVLRLGGLDSAAVGARVGLDDIDRLALRPAPRWMIALWGGRATAMTLPWAIYVHPRLLVGDRQALGELLVHELVHVRQWRELGVRRFLVRYLADYWRGRRSGLGHRRAYMAISLEEEARRLSAPPSDT
jgi:hypothetical protein